MPISTSYILFRLPAPHIHTIIYHDLAETRLLLLLLDPKP